MNKFSLLTGSVFILSIFSNLAFGQYYKTLPKGIRTVEFRNVKTSKVNSSYNHSKSESPYSYDIEANVKTLESIDNDSVKAILSILAPYQDAYNALNLGTYHIDADANVQVDVFGFGYGITNKVTAYFGLPMYQADVRMKYNRPQGNSYNKVAEILQGYTNDDFAQGIGSNIEAYGNQLDIDGSFLQNLVVNHFNYNEVGDWHGEGPGDMEFGVMYNFLQKDNWGLLLSFGGVAPTGRVDDPDTIQDFGFGDGQWDIFAEFGGGISPKSWLNVNSWFRYTNQLASEKKLRVPYSSDVFIGDQKGVFTEKLGNKFVYHVSTDFIINDWISFNTAYEYSHTDAAQYTALDSKNAYAESILASNTESVQHNVKVSADVSSVTPFMKNNFLLPASVRFSYQKMIEGRNTPKVDRYEIAFRMFF